MGEQDGGQVATLDLAAICLATAFVAAMPNWV